jgi:hypothetical protein
MTVSSKIPCHSQYINIVCSYASSLTDGIVASVQIKKTWHFVVKTNASVPAVKKIRQEGKWRGGCIKVKKYSVYNFSLSLFFQLCVLIL